MDWKDYEYEVFLNVIEYFTILESVMICLSKDIIQAEWAIPFSGRYGVVINAPFAWIIDGSQGNGFVTSL